jgi:hypothetical protein
MAGISVDGWDFSRVAGVKIETYISLEFNFGEYWN